MAEPSHAELLGIDLEALERERFSNPAQALHAARHRHNASLKADWERNRRRREEKDLRERELGRLAEKWAGGELADG